MGSMRQMRRKRRKMSEKNLHLKKVIISTELLMDMCTQGWATGGLSTVEGIPPGAKFVSAYVDQKAQVNLVVSHPDFPVIDTGEVLMNIPVSIRPQPNIDAEVVEGEAPTSSTRGKK